MTENYAEKMLDALSSGQLDTAQKLLHNHCVMIVMK